LRDVSKVFADERLDIRHARIVTLGDNVVDTFYVRDANGKKMNDAMRRDAVSAALIAVLA